MLVRSVSITRMIFGGQDRSLGLNSSTASSVSTLRLLSNIRTKMPQQQMETIAHSNGNDNAEVCLKSADGYLFVKKLSSKATLPSRASAKAAGYDLSGACECVVPARGKCLVQTDLSIAIPESTYARIAPRSGLAWKHSIDVGAGVIDADYRGPVGVILFNHSDKDFEIKVGDRIAQLILEKIVTPEVQEVDNLDDTVRGADGFGSTGI
eukprot:TRINITY_DN1484_c0_g1_i1.p1 TRINITY_DN1484_c0_g1~~TRINITY_DN1484_c0_g1_i1.p1  ORF type:complete len:209 (-),score=15.97 TRINITY_DN1484_c0_g1_i1:84-710(-)